MLDEFALRICIIPVIRGEDEVRERSVVEEVFENAVIEFVELSNLRS